MSFMTDVKNAPGGPAVDPVWDQHTPVRDQSAPSGTNGGWRGMFGIDWLLYGLIAAVSLGVGVVNALSAAQDATRRGKPYDLGTPLFWEISSITAIIVAAPLIFVAVGAMRRMSRWWLRLGLGLAMIVGFSALHIAGMVGIRKLSKWLTGSFYDFHFSGATLLYEFRKDVVTAVLICGVVWLIHARDEARRANRATPSAPQPSPPAPHMVWLRDGASRIRIEPRDIVWIGSAGNYIEYVMASGANHLVRGTLAAAESQLGRFNLARVHRTRLANLGRVTSVETKASGDFELTFDTGQTVQGSRRYRAIVEALDRGAAVI